MKTPWERIAGGVFVLTATVGIILLDVLHRPADMTLTAIAIAGVTVYLGARNYNAGNYSGKKDKDGNGNGDSGGN